MSTGVAICPRCLKEFSNEVSVCPHDGRKLVMTQSNEMDRAGEVIDGQFTLLGTLGAGGMGSVYRALQHSMEREVAIKILRKSLSSDTTIVRRFLQEAKEASHLNHPNIITLFDFGQSENGELYISMELLQGQTLREILTTTGAIDAARTVAIMTQVCDALGAAHEKGIVHRDLKPDNIFIIEGAGQLGEFVKVLDFGIAKIMVNDESNNITQSGVICGTPAYMSPEQVLGNSVDARSDIYSAALVVYEMLAGTPPFAANAPMAVMMAQVRQKAPTLAKMRADLILPHRLEEVISRAMSKKPEHRPQSVHALKEQMIAAINEVGGTQTKQGLGNMETLYAHPAPTNQQDGLENFDQLTSTVSLEGLPAVVVEEDNTEKAKGEVEPQSAPVENGPALEATKSVTSIPAHQFNGLPWLITLITILIAVAVVSYQVGSNQNVSAPADTPPTSHPIADPSTEKSPGAHPPRETDTAPQSTDKSSETHKTPKAPTEAATQPSMSEPETEATTLISTIPPGAPVYAGNILLGRTPLNLIRPKANSETRLSLRLSGYESVEYKLTEYTPDQLTLKLSKIQKRRSRKINNSKGVTPEFAR